MGVKTDTTKRQKGKKNPQKDE